MKNKLANGSLGEAVAARYLIENHGFRLLEQNYRKPWGEIDLIMEKGSVVHFIEVKTVSRGNNIAPEENLHRKKLRRLVRVVHSYTLERQCLHWRLDAVLVVLDREAKRAEVELIENIGLYE